MPNIVFFLQQTLQITIVLIYNLMQLLAEINSWQYPLPRIHGVTCSHKKRVIFKTRFLTNQTTGIL
ncbi:hypothetical protein LJC19_04450 [Oxalobacter sp. OttesenSCG-928-P03]|nr:hypothetical protein [Oxalobacter sp. OttesenSCG-928-P03]